MCRFLQGILAGLSRKAWALSPRGLGQADLAMNVVLPELDGRLLTGPISYKNEAAEIPGSMHVRTLHEPDTDGLALTADRAAGWAKLATTQPQARELAIIVADYPGAGGQKGHAVGLDTFASLETITGLSRGGRLRRRTKKNRGVRLAGPCFATRRRRNALPLQNMKRYLRNFRRRCANMSSPRGAPRQPIRT